MSLRSLRLSPSSSVFRADSLNVGRARCGLRDTSTQASARRERNADRAPAARDRYGDTDAGDRKIPEDTRSLYTGDNTV